MGLFQWIAAKLARPTSTEHPTPEPDVVVPTIVADEGPEDAVAERRRRAIEKLQEKLDRHLDAVASGGPASMVGFRDLIEFLLRLTVMDPDARPPCLKVRKKGRSHVMDGRVPLNDGRFLYFRVYLTAPAHRRLTVGRSVVQYEEGPGCDEWIWRWDDHPPWDFKRRRPHFNNNPVWWDRHHKGASVPTHNYRPRQTMESLIRLLADRFFHVPCNVEREIWDPLLVRSERWFKTARSH